MCHVRPRFVVMPAPPVRPGGRPRRPFGGPINVLNMAMPLVQERRKRAICRASGVSDGVLWRVRTGVDKSGVSAYPVFVLTEADDVGTL